MRIGSLQLQDFRNLAEVSLDPSPRLTVLLGRNGQGKTNLLEAVYLLTTLRPLRAARLAELVRFGQPRASLGATVTRGTVERRLSVEVLPGQRNPRFSGQ